MTATTRLCVRLTFIEGALIRLLGLAGRRGFDIAKVDARTVDGGRAYEVTLELLGPRCPVTLQRQIAKLYDVERVEIVPALYDTPPLRLVVPDAVAV
jgi:acetolactate synthase regulatory subunit